MKLASLRNVPLEPLLAFLLLGLMLATRFSVISMTIIALLALGITVLFALQSLNRKKHISAMPALLAILPFLLTYPWYITQSFPIGVRFMALIGVSVALYGIGSFFVGRNQEGQKSNHQQN